MSKNENELKPIAEVVRKKTFALNKEALSPIFATLIILAVVTVLFIPVFIWATGTTSQTQESWQTSGLIATERIVIEEVSIKAGISTSSIYVRNIGKTVVTINNALIIAPDGRVYTYEKTGGLSTADPVSGSAKESILQGELIEIDIVDFGDLALIQDQSYTVKVFTTRGVGDAYQVVA